MLRPHDEGWAPCSRLAPCLGRDPLSGKMRPRLRAPQLFTLPMRRPARPSACSRLSARAPFHGSPMDAPACCVARLLRLSREPLALEHPAPALRGCSFPRVSRCEPRSSYPARERGRKKGRAIALPSARCARARPPPPDVLCPWLRETSVAVFSRSSLTPFHYVFSGATFASWRLAKIQVQL